MSFRNYSTKKIADVVKGTISDKNEERVINEILIDSRQLIEPEHTLFFAIKSQRNDGHKYIADLYKRGVRAFVVTKKPDAAMPDATFIVVKDTLEALQALAAYHRSQFTMPVIGITGSNGKTVVKEWLFQLLSHNFSIARSPKSYNSQIGVPLSVWQMQEQNNLAIFEAGISQTGEMQKLRDIIHPTIGIFTNIGEAHEENFINRTQKAGEKLNLFTKVDTLIYCMDHSEIQQVIMRSGIANNVKLLSWSRKFKEASIFVESEQKKEKKTEITCLYEGRKITFEIPFTDSASTENAIHCLATALLLKMPDEDIIQNIAKIVPIAMRLELKSGNNNCTIINDYYNSDINSLAIALDVMNQQSQHSNKTVILSDILQSGLSDEHLYKKVAHMLELKNVDSLIGIGSAISRQANKFKPNSTFYPTVKDFLEDYPINDFHNQTILLKGARQFEFEQISKVLQEKVHETVLEINFSNLVSNLNYYKSKIKPETKLMAMVKAFSYGSGNLEVCNILQFYNVDYVTVAFADEGVDLRRAGITLPIMVMSPEANSYDNIVKYNLEPEVFSFRNLAMIENAVANSSKSTPIGIHVKLDTGMHRLGFAEADIPELIERIKANPMLHIKSIFSHLATADNADEDAFTMSQINCFERVSNMIVEAFPYKIIRHILNTAGITRYTKYQFDMVRLGIGLYGVPVCPEDAQHLKAVAALRTTISQIKDIPQGDSIGYNRHGRATRPMRIGIIPIGYADGIPRLLGNGNATFYIKGQPVKIVGDVCMDMCMLDLTDIEANEGDIVTIFDDEHSVSDLAKCCNTIPYELMTRVSQRVKRVYFQE